MKSRQEIKLIAKLKIADQRSTTICAVLIVIGISMLSAIPILGFVVSLVSIVLSVSLAGFFTYIYRDEQISASAVLDGLKVNFLRKLGSIFCVGLFAFLWSLLFYIPGIIKMISYIFTPYILAEFPDVGAMDAIKISQRLTKGYKMEIFIMQLSFIGWWILSAFTFGILAVVYVLPYYDTTIAGYYTEILNDALDRGIVTHEELGIKHEDFNNYN